jgi:mRNA deadenylase 3'-5' endonuclease subunit Ccr4
VLFFATANTACIQAFGIPFLRTIFNFPYQMNTKPKAFIRTQSDPDPCLQGISSVQDLQDKIHEVRKLQFQYNNADMYLRQWKPDPRSTISPDSCSASTSDPSSSTSTSSTLSVLQFNALAQGLSMGPIPTPFERDTDHDANSLKSIYGGFTDVPHPEITLDFDLRKWRLMEVLLGAPSSTDSKPQHQCNKEQGCHQDTANYVGYDVIAMEEVDQFHGFFEPLLKMMGYQGLFIPKPYSPCVVSGWYSDGCAFFWKIGELELIKEEQYSYQQGNQVYLIVALRHLATGKIMEFAMTHLKAGQGVKNEVLRSVQVQELMHRLSCSALSASKEHGVELNNIPVILMGDFNSDIREEASCIQSVISKYGTLCPCPLTSVYKIDPPDPSLFTTWKIRGPTTQKRIIDYIFCNDEKVHDFECTHILDVPDEEEMELTKLPGFKYPSDHLAIGARFRLSKT